MFSLKVSTVFLALVAAASATTFSTLAVHETLPAVPKGYMEVGPAPAEHKLTLRIALTANNLEGLQSSFEAISTPGNARYRQHLSKDEVVAFTKPADETTSLVKQWLSENKIDAKTISPAGDWLEIAVPVSDANKLLDADFTVFRDAEGNDAVRTLKYSIPDTLQGHVDLVHPTISMPTSSGRLPLTGAARPSVAGRATSSCESAITPACLQSAYGIPTTPATESTNTLFVSAFEGQWVSTEELEDFLSDYRPDMSDTTKFTVLKINGGTNKNSPDESGEEATLDIQYTVGLATGVPISFATVGPTDIDSNTQFLDAVLAEVNYFVGLDTVPTTLTTSYGIDETGLSKKLATSICNGYMSLGARGTSILYSSGDGGVAGGHGDSCTDEPFIPVFPAGCPWVTAVGATQLVSAGNEEGASFSSGGFSNFFAQPSYQTAAAAAFLEQLGDEYSGRYNAQGRGFPDVSANGVNFALHWDGQTDYPASGTSCSSPTFASVIALINDRLIAAGASPLGFLNPFLYANADALNDITSGDNPGCGTNGFTAVTGWDPITGLGTPNFDALLSAAQSS